MSLIEIADVKKTYVMGDMQVHALRGVSLSIEESEFVAIMGSSGSGKSTLMAILGGLDRPTSGRYRLDDIDMSTLPKSELARARNKKIGFVFQQFHLLSRTTALENVELPLMYAHGVSGSERHARAREALAHVGLADREDHKPNQLSGGQQQRVAIARALVTDPPLLLADEPTGNLDTHTGEDILSLIRELHQRLGSTIVIVTHDMHVAESCSRTIALRDGRLVQDISRDHLRPAVRSGASA
jgi:putative ABC transport system ATP-binding protein